MRFEIEAAARTRVVDLAGAQGRFQVVVDGNARAVDAVRVGATWSLLVGPAEAGPHVSLGAGPHVSLGVGAGFSRPARSYEVTIASQAAGALIVHVNGRAVPIRIGGRRGAGRVRRGEEQTAAAASGPQRVVVPMPGRVLKVLVKAGDAVAARQGLVVVEAMKMENEIRSGRAGIVKEVRVAEGASVDANTVLIVIE